MADPTTRRRILRVDEESGPAPGTGLGVTVEEVVETTVEKTIRTRTYDEQSTHVEAFDNTNPRVWMRQRFSTLDLEMCIYHVVNVNGVFWLAYCVKGVRSGNVYQALTGPLLMHAILNNEYLVQKGAAR